MVQRHETLRTSFQAQAGEPVQHIHAQVSLPPLVVEDLSTVEASQQAAQVQMRAQQEAATPFELSEAPLLRWRVLRLGEEEHVVLLSLHHIIADGWSLGVLIQEIATFYRQVHAGQEVQLAPLPIQYADFAAWQRAWLQDERLRRQQDYWREQLAGAPPLLDLPTDFVRPAQQHFAGGQVSVELTAD